MFKATQYLIASGNIAALEFGDRETAEISVVFIHGWLDNAASFLSTMTCLSNLVPHIHLCAIDLPGHGLSDHKHGSNFYLFHDYMDDICQILAKLPANKRVMVGHSLGALISSCYSAAFPEQVDGLVQIEGYGPLSETATNSLERLRNGVISRQRIRKKPIRGYDSVEQAIEQRVRVNHLTAEAIAPVVERGIEQVNGKWCWRHDPNLKSDSLYRMSPEQAADIMAGIRCPQRVILGEHGYPDLFRNYDISGKYLLETFTIPGNHHCHLEHPSVVAELILGVLNKI